MTQSHDRNKDKESGTNLMIICLSDTMCSLSLRSILFYYDLKAPAQYCIGKAKPLLRLMFEPMHGSVETMNH